jgi:ABC-type dipeptide/oligopeptide/nickel transport system permease subunit
MGIMAESSMSFLGLGAQPPLPSWGSMVSGGLDYLRVAPWMSLAPGIGITIAVLGFNLLGDACRDVLDPRLSRSRRG